MTRLYVNVRCEKCNEIHGSDVGAYFGKTLGDKGYVQGLCGACEAKEMLGKDLLKQNQKKTSD